MPVKLYEGDKNETGGIGIEVTDNKVINLILRSLNNLIKVNDNNEVYTDLQLDDNLLSTATLPVGVTTGRVIQANGRPVTGTLLCAKTTSGDVSKFIYGNDGNIYVDNGTGERNMLVNVKVFFISGQSEFLTVGQKIYDRIEGGKYAIVNYNSRTYLLTEKTSTNLLFKEVSNTVQTNSNNTQIGEFRLNFVISSGTVVDATAGWYSLYTILDTSTNYSTPYNPMYPCSPATKKYVDDKVVIDSNAPATPQAGQFWYDTTSSTLSLYDGTQRLSI